MDCNSSEPNLSHLKAKDFEYIYEPSEDSFLFLQSLDVEKEFLLNMKPLICLEIGSGSGIISAYFQALLGSDNFLHICTDINIRACNASQNTGLYNNCIFNVANCSLTQPFSQRLHGSVDVILFNPPYVPTEEEETIGMGITAAYAGGENGRKVIDKFVTSAHYLLSSKGVIYLLICSENDQKSLTSLLLSFGLSTSVVLHKHCGGENLSVLKICKLKAKIN